MCTFLPWDGHDDTRGIRQVSHDMLNIDACEHCHWVKMPKISGQNLLTLGVRIHTAVLSINPYIRAIQASLNDVNNS